MNYLIPANSKKGQLIFNIFRWVDLIIVLVGGIVTLALMFAIPGDGLLVVFVKLLPVGVCLLLVLPIPYYHNVLVLLGEVYYYLSNQKKYHWKGWCVKDGLTEQ